MTFSNRWNSIAYRLWAPIYDAMLGLHPVTKVRAAALSRAGAADANRVLLIGVGTGADLKYLAPSARAVGIDLTSAMLKRARREAERLPRQFEPICGDANQLPFADSQFDLTVLTLVISVVPEPMACIEEAWRVLRPGGRMLVLDKFLPGGTPPSRIRRLVNLLTRFFGTDINRRWEDLSTGAGITLLDEAAPGWPSIRTIIVQKQSVTGSASESPRGR